MPVLLFQNPTVIDFYGIHRDLHREIKISCMKSMIMQCLIKKWWTRCRKMLENNPRLRYLVGKSKQSLKMRKCFSNRTWDQGVILKWISATVMFVTFTKYSFRDIVVPHNVKVVKLPINPLCNNGFFFMSLGLLGPNNKNGVIKESHYLFCVSGLQHFRCDTIS